MAYESLGPLDPSPVLLPTPVGTQRMQTLGVPQSHCLCWAWERVIPRPVEARLLLEEQVLVVSGNVVACLPTASCSWCRRPARCSRKDGMSPAVSPCLP